MGDRFYDFDAAWAEVEGYAEAPGIRVFGEEIDLPAEPPAGFMLKLIALKERTDGDGLSEASLVEVLALLRPFYGERVDRWVEENALGMGKAMGLVDATLERYRPKKAVAADVDAEGESSAPATSSSNETSSKDGGSSKPTGDASTAST